MARRRVNLQFILIIAVILLGGVVLAVVAKKVIFKENPKRYVEEGRRKVREGLYADAKSNFEQALRLDPRDPDVHVRLGDCMHLIARTDPSAGGFDRRYYEQALAIDPTYRPALQKLMDLEIETVEFDSRPASFQRLHDVAQKVIDLPPYEPKKLVNPTKLELEDAEIAKKDAEDAKPRAEAYIHISTLAGWVMGIIRSDEVVNDEIKALVDLQTKYPGNPDVPYYLANAYLKQARELKVQGRDKEQEANVLFDKAVAVFDQALQSEENKKNAVVYIRFYTVLRIANQLVSENDNLPDKEKYVNRMRTVLDQARKYITKDDAGFTDVYIQSGQFALRHNEPEKAETLMRQMVKERPDDQTARLALADLLHSDPAKRPEIIQLLKKDITDLGMTSVTQQRSKRELELQTYLDLSKYLIEQWYTTSDEGEKATIRADIDKYSNLLAQREPLHSETLKLKAKIVLMKDPKDPRAADAPINAIPIIEEAINSFNVRNSNAGAGNKKDWELEYMLAKCYFDSHQTGEATARLIKITDAVPLYAPAHQLLAQLLLDNNDTDLAAEQLKILHKLTPNDPLLARLDLMLLAKMGKTASLDADIEKMPENTLLEKETKAQIFLVTGNPSQALRLLQLVLKEKPTDFATVDAVCRIYWIQLRQKDKAREVATAAAEKDPSNLELEVLSKQFNGASKEEVEKAVRAAIAATKDPFVREMKWFDFLYNKLNSTEEALKHLDAAEQLKPNDPKVLDLRFQFAANYRKWDQAEIYIRKLANINADQARGQIYRYRIALAKGDINAAAELAQDMVKTLPQYARSWLCLANVQQMQGSYQEAVTNYTYALERQSGNPDALRGAIECQYALNRPLEALRLIQQGLRMTPNNAYLREEKIKYDLAYGDPTDALTPRIQFRDAVAADAATAGKKEEMQAWIMLGGAYFQVAQRMTDNNKAADAKKFVDLARETFVKGSEKWPDEKLFYAYLADLATFTKDTAAGEKALRDLAERPEQAKRPEARLLLADYYLRGGQVDSAEKAMKEAIELAQDTPEKKLKTDIKQKLAAFYVQQGKFDPALELLDENSTEQGVQLQRVETFVAAGKLPDAQAALDKMLAATPKDPQLLAMSGFLLTVARQSDAAMKVFDAALVIDPKNQTALYQRGRLFLARATDGVAKGRDDEARRQQGVENALRDLTAARDLAPKNVQTRLALAEAYLVKGDNDACIREMVDAVKNQPGDKVVRLKLLELYARQTPPRWIDVERLIRESLAMPEFTRDPDWYRAEANMWLARKDSDKAVKAMESAIKLANTLNLPPAKMGPLQQDYLNVLLQGKKYQDLLANCNSLLADPRVAEKVWWVYQLRAIAYRYTDQKDKALLDFDKAITIATAAKDDAVVMTLMESIAETIGAKEAAERLRQKVEAGDTHWRVILAYLYLKGEEYLSAVTVMDKVMADTSTMQERERLAAFDIAGVIYMQAREYPKAINVYNRILAATPDSIGALNNLACITGELNENPQPNEALKYSKKAITLLEDRGGVMDANIADTHGWMLTLAGQMDEGIKYLRMALDRQAFPECQYHLGFALMQKNQAADAVTELEKAKKLNDDKRKRNEKVDAKLEAKIDEALSKARQMASVAP